MRRERKERKVRPWRTRRIVPSTSTGPLSQALRCVISTSLGLPDSSATGVRRGEGEDERAEARTLGDERVGGDGASLAGLEALDAERSPDLGEDQEEGKRSRCWERPRGGNAPLTSQPVYHLIAFLKVLLSPSVRVDKSEKRREEHEGRKKDEERAEREQHGCPNGSRPPPQLA